MRSGRSYVKSHNSKQSRCADMNLMRMLIKQRFGIEDQPIKHLHYTRVNIQECLV